MKQVIVNKCYGGIDDFLKFHRYDEEYIQKVQKGEFKTMFCNPQVVYLPDGITDHIIVENDGYETIYYVLNGKIYER